MFFLEDASELISSELISSAAVRLSRRLPLQMNWRGDCCEMISELTEATEGAVSALANLGATQKSECQHDDSEIWQHAENPRRVFRQYMVAKSGTHTGSRRGKSG